MSSTYRKYVHVSRQAQEMRIIQAKFSLVIRIESLKKSAETQLTTKIDSSQFDCAEVRWSQFTGIDHPHLQG